MAINSQYFKRSYCYLILSILLTSQAYGAVFRNLDSPFKSRIIAIEQDQTGLIWVATDSMVASYDGYQFNQLNLHNGLTLDSKKINSIKFIGNNEMLIGTKQHGLLRYNLATLSKPIPEKTIAEKTIYSMTNHNDVVWVASPQGVYKLTTNLTEFYTYKQPDRYINKIIGTNDDQLLIASKNQLLSFDPKNHSFREIDYHNDIKPSYIWDIHLDNSENLWVSTDIAIFQLKANSDKWVKLNSDEPRNIVTSMASSNQNIWFGNATGGIEEHAIDTENKYFSHYLTNNSSLINNNTTQLFFDRHENLWIGFFDGTLSVLNTRSLTLGLNVGTFNQSSCLDTSKLIHHIAEDNHNNVWLSTQQEFIKLDLTNNSCNKITIELDSNSEANIPIPTLTFNDHTGSVWTYVHRLGLIKLNDLQGSITQTEHPINEKDKIFYQFVTQNSDSKFIFASSRGLIEYDIENKKLTTLVSENNVFEKSIVYNSFQSGINKFMLATSQGIAIYDRKTIKKAEKLQKQLPTKQTSYVYQDSHKNLWVGTLGSGLFKFNSENELIQRYGNNSGLSKQQDITNILEDEHDNLWVSSTNGLIKLNILSNKAHVFYQSDGLQADSFNIGSSLKTRDGKMFFGGVNGFNSFYPHDVSINHTAPPIILAELSRFNKIVVPGLDYDGFQISQSINFLENLAISHQDYIIGFKFAALDFAAPERNQYAYMLEGFDPDWNFVNADSRIATYTNLPSGDYVFKVKGSNKDGIWNSDGKSLKIKVIPAPWFSWWALLSYVIITLTLIFWYINKKTKNTQIMAALLKQEVTEKTKELHIKKQTVESLLAQKNQLFSNVSHEFRTPLTLILGPIKNLIGKNLHSEDLNSLQLINRNAFRLLSLVEQLLQLAKVSDFKKTPTQIQKTENQVKAVFDSFLHIAKLKRVKLLLTLNTPSQIDVTDQFIDAVLGNLISNAVKFTPINGRIEVRAEQQSNGQFILSVKDNGIGLTENQKVEIFQRFKRLESHQKLEGTGIGLSVVDEIVKINNGNIHLISEINKGSEFIVSLPVADKQKAKFIKSNLTLINQLKYSGENQVAEPLKTNFNEATSKNTILIIEDNQDMQQHIAQCISPYYNVIQAMNGQSGVAIAMEHIPDLIICDVMMPIMDGYKVSRIIRSDQKTSHIPLVLLTALVDKASRIKGWREHVDAYMTKPFDQDELLVQLYNILTIRDILKKRVGMNLLKGEALSNILPKKDQQFIDKLINVIKTQYQNPVLNRAKIASAMAVSDRQLQRKLKAMTDQNPTDMLREFRLKKASELLKDGYQVSQIADDCGFNSLSYFSQCFKAQFGMSPKAYQQLKRH